MVEFIVRNIRKNVDLACYKDSVTALKALNGFCRKFNKDMDHYMVLKRTIKLDGSHFDEIVTEFE